MWVLVLVAVLVVAALAVVVVFVISSAPPPPAGATLDHVTVTSSATTPFYVSQSATFTAAAVDSAGVTQTANATFSWSASPAASASIAPGTTANSARVTALLGGTITITATATLNKVSKSGQANLTATGLAFVLSASNSHPLVPYDPTQSPFDLTVTAVTSANVTYQNYQGTIHFTSTDPSATLPPDTLLSVANKGVIILANVSITLPGAVVITATDAAFSSITGSVTVTGNRAPTASFTITGNPSDPRIISVDGSASSDPDTGETLSYSWAFGDGATGSGITATHTYVAAGAYNIALTVSDNFGASNTLVKAYAAHSPPTAVVSVKSQTANGVDTMVWANGSKSTGGDGTIVYYNWTWGDGTQTQTTISLAAHNYSATWTGQSVTLTLRVANNYSLTNTSSTTFVVTTAKLPPIATFTSSYSVGPVVNRHTYRTLSVDASGSSSPTGTALLYYVWSWGDGSPIANLTTATTTHQYTNDGTYLVNLTVIDANMLKGYYEVSVIIAVAPAAPAATFLIAHVKLYVSVDANGTTDVNNNIAFYIWDWGDGSATTNTTLPYAAHTYAGAGRFLITLTVWDTTNLKGTATGYASVAASTLDYSFYDFFNVPYGEWWDMRNHAYGDLPINTNCFNATSIATGRCKISNTALPNNESYPYTDWYPAPFGSLFYQQPSNDPLIYAPYRFQTIGSSVPGYNVSEPVFLPVLNYAAAPGSYLLFNWNMQYLDTATANALTSAGCPGVKAASDDGFMIRSRVYLTMDAQEARRIFGMPASANTPNLESQWFAGNVNSACGTSGALETAITNALNTEGNGKYDIWNSFQYPYTTFYTNLSQPVVAANGSITIYMEHAAWGTETLMSRWFYWGNSSYAADYLDSSKAKGWWGMELAWFEDFHFSGGLSASAMNFLLNTVLQYHFQLNANGGSDGYLNHVNDVPYWVWGPWLSDYVAASTQHPYSELTRWNGQTYLHSTAGGSNYNKSLAFDYAPSSWAAHYGETWHFVFPASIMFYDPNRTPVPANPLGGFQYWTGSSQGVPYMMWKTNPASYGTYTNSTWTWDVAGNVLAGTYPAGWPTGALNDYPTVPWGSIFLAPWGATLKVAAVVATAPVLAANSGPSPSLATPGPSLPIASSPLVAWTTVFVAAPALWAPAVFRARL